MMSMPFSSSTNKLLLRYARSLVLERDGKLVVRSKVFIGSLNLVKIRLIHQLYNNYNIVLSSLNSNLHLQT